MPGIKYPCAACKKSCRVNQKAIFCDICQKWIHLKCTNLTIKEFVLLGNSDTPYFYSECCIDIFSFQNLTDKEFKDNFSVKSKSQIDNIIGTSDYETDQPNYYLTPIEFKN